MKAARSWGVRPSEFFDKWSARDRSLALGLQAFEDGFYMGVPVDRAYDDDMDGWIEAKPRINQVDAAIERAQKDAADVAPGTRWVIEYTEPPKKD